jgi:hypothetical protein
VRDIAAGDLIKTADAIALVILFHIDFPGLQSAFIGLSAYPVTTILALQRPFLLGELWAIHDTGDVTVSHVPGCDGLA